MVVCNVAYNAVCQVADLEMMGGSTGAPKHLGPADVDQKRQRLAPECIEGDMRWPSAYGVDRSLKMLENRCNHGWASQSSKQAFCSRLRRTTPFAECGKISILSISHNMSMLQVIGGSTLVQ
jgi:hypothetical protein